MRIQCVREFPTEEQVLQLGSYYRPGKQVFHVQVGKEYLVYGITFLSGCPWVELKEDFGYLHRAPLGLFEITDGRVSSYWETRCIGRDICFWPPSFYREYYFDDLLEGVEEVLEDFRTVSSRVEAEFN